jgi:DNA-binding GntR family transcriptional regulator
MVNPTNRDEVWKAALTITLRKGEPVKPSRIADLTGVSERMARECLLVMSESGWLQREALSDGTIRYIAPREIDYTIK